MPTLYCQHFSKIFNSQLSARIKSMIDALISGRLVRQSELKTGKSGKYYTQFLLSVSVGVEEQPVLVSGMAFQEQAERIARLQKGDPLAVIGSLKPSEWTDKATGESKHGLSVVVSNCLSVYDIKKRRPKEQHAVLLPQAPRPEPYFNDDIPF
jgi:single-stranded DNA-binding protein